MASWTDGAAYAPLERPDGFATPEVEPLDVAVPDAAQTPGPLPTPADFRPTGPTTPLDHVRTTRPPTRDPSAPFQVGAGLMTIASSMGANDARDPRLPFQSYGDDALPISVEALPPPTGAPLQAPANAPFLSTGGHPSGTPAPRPPSGVSGQSTQQQSSQRTLVFLGIVCAVLGLIIPAVAAWMLFFAGMLTLRAKPLVGQAGAWSMGVGLALLVFGGLVAPGAAEALGRLATLAFIAWFGFAAIRRSRPQR